MQIYILSYSDFNRSFKFIFYNELRNHWHSTFFVIGIFSFLLKFIMSLRKNIVMGMLFKETFFHNVPFTLLNIIRLKI